MSITVKKDSQDKVELLEEISRLITKVATEGPRVYTDEEVATRAKNDELEVSVYCKREELVKWSRKQIQFITRSGDLEYLRKTLYEDQHTNFFGIVLVSHPLWMEIVSSKEFLNYIDPSCRFDDILDGKLGTFDLGTFDGRILYTDGYMEPEFTLLKPTEFVLLPKCYPMNRLLLARSYIEDAVRRGVV